MTLNQAADTTLKHSLFE